MATCGAQRSKEKMKGGWRSAAKQRENDRWKNKLDEARESGATNKLGHFLVQKD